MKCLARIMLVALCVLLAPAPAARAENYAVFFAGGNNDEDNWEIYYDEILRHYKHVVNRWNYKPENVWVIFADGMNSYKDLTMWWPYDPENSDWSYVDDKHSTVLEASYDNTRDVLTGLQDLGPGDLFYFWSYDHGYGDTDVPSHHDEEGFSGWNQWENNDIDDDVFAGWVNPIGAGRHAYVLGQCYSGGILEELQMINLPPGHRRFGCASATHQEPSQSGEGFEGFNDAWCDGIENEDLTFTQHLYVYAYNDTDCATDGEGPNADYSWNVQHPWMRGDNFFLPVSVWEGSGAGGSSTNWEDASNWSYWNEGGSVRVAFETAGQAIIDEQLTLAGYLTLNWAEELGGAANVIINAGADFYCQTADIGKVGTEANPSWGSLVQNGGDAHFDVELVLGDKPYSRGYYTLNGGNVYVHGGQGGDGEMVVGDEGYGYVAQFGGNVYLTYVPLRLGRETQGDGWYELLGGQIEVSDVYVGYEGTGNFSQVSGSHNVSGTLHVGHADGSMGTYTQSGGSLVAQTIQIGQEDGSQGTFSMSGGMLNADNILLGFEAGSQAHFTVGSSGDPAVVLVTNRIRIGDHEGTGTFLVNDGAQVFASVIEVGDWGNGSLFQGGGTIQADAEIIGEFGGDDQDALYEHSGGTNNVYVNLFVGGSGSASAGPGRPPVGRYNLSGSGVLDIGGSLFIGDYGTGDFTHHESTVSVEGGLFLGSDGGTGTYTMPDSATTSPALTVAGHAFVGSDGVGTFSQYNGTHTVGNNLYVGKDSGADGTYELQNDAVLDVGGDTYVGFVGSGEFQQTGGTHLVAGNLDVGYVAGSDGAYVLTGGTLNVHNGTIRVGLGDTGDFTLNGGTVIADTFDIGTFGTLGGSGAGTLRVNHMTGLEQQATIHGSLQLGHGGGSGSGDLYLEFNRTLEVTGDLTVGHSASADLTVVGSSLTVPDVCAGSGLGAHGTVNLTTSILTANNIYLGAFGTAALDQNGGTTDVAGDLMVAGGFSPNASYTLRSSSSILLANNEIIGGAGIGTFAHSNGTNSVVDTLTVGSGATGNGTYHIQDGTVETATLVVGQNGIGQFTQGDGGGNTVTATTVRLGGNADGEGTYELWDGQLHCTSLIIGDAGTGTFHQSSDVTAINDVIVSSQVGSHGTYNLDAGTLSANRLRVGGGSGTDGTFHWSYGTLSVPTIQVWQGGTFNVNDRWDFDGALEVSGGTLDMAGGTCSLYLDAPGDGATLTIASGGSVNSWNQVVGNTQKAAVTHTGGSNTVASLMLGNNPGAEGTYDFSGGVLTSTYTDVGVFGTGTFTQLSGTFHAGQSLNVGYSASTGTYHLQNGSVETEDLKIGVYGTGDFHYTGGVLLASSVEVGPGGTMEVGVDWFRNGTLTINGGNVYTTGIGTAIGLGTGGTGDEGGTGTLDISDGTLNATTLCVGYDGTGTVMQTGGTVTGNLLWIGHQGPGEYTYEGGDLTMNGILVRPGGTLMTATNWTYGGALHVDGGTVDLADGSLILDALADGALANLYSGTTQAMEEYVGYAAKATVTQTGGDNLISGALYLGHEPGSEGIYHLEGGTLSAAEIYVGVQGSGQLRWTGGTLDTQFIAVGADGTFAMGLTQEYEGDLNCPDGGQVIVDIGTEVTLSGIFGIDPGAAFSKGGGGTLIIDGPQEHGPGASFDILGGTVNMNTDAGNGGYIDVSILVDNAVLSFGCNQYLDTLAIDNGALVRLNGANVVVVKNLVMNGVPLGPTTLTPEPATLALLAAGGVGLLVRRRRRHAA